MGYPETYEFFAIDRPLRAGEMSALRRLSRAKIVGHAAVAGVARGRRGNLPARAMSSAKRSLIREGRIANEIVVDAYTESERAMGWYYYLENRLRPERVAPSRSLTPRR